MYVLPLAFAWWFSRYVRPDRSDATVPDGLALPEIAQTCAPLLQPELCGRALHRLQEGLQVGWKAGNLLAQRWEWPLADRRHEVGIELARDWPAEPSGCGACMSE